MSPFFFPSRESCILFLPRGLQNKVLPFPNITACELDNMVMDFWILHRFFYPQPKLIQTYSSHNDTQLGTEKTVENIF